MKPALSVQASGAFLIALEGAGPPGDGSLVQHLKWALKTATHLRVLATGPRHLVSLEWILIECKSAQRKFWLDSCEKNLQRIRPSKKMKKVCHSGVKSNFLINTTYPLQVSRSPSAVSW